MRSTPFSFDVMAQSIRPSRDVIIWHIMYGFFIFSPHDKIRLPKITGAEFYYIFVVPKLLFDKGLSCHFLGLRKLHDLKHCGAQVSENAALLELAVIAYNDKGNRICGVSGER